MGALVHALQVAQQRVRHPSSGPSCRLGAAHGAHPSDAGGAERRAACIGGEHGPALAERRWKLPIGHPLRGLAACCSSCVGAPPVQFQVPSSCCPPPLCAPGCKGLVDGGGGARTPHRRASARSPSARCTRAARRRASWRRRLGGASPSAQPSPRRPRTPSSWGCSIACGAQAGSGQRRGRRRPGSGPAAPTSERRQRRLGVGGGLAAVGGGEERRLGGGRPGIGGGLRLWALLRSGCGGQQRGWQRGWIGREAGCGAAEKWRSRILRAHALRGGILKLRPAGRHGSPQAVRQPLAIACHGRAMTRTIGSPQAAGPPQAMGSSRAVVSPHGVAV